MSEFLNMGGYALYVWSSYGIAFLIMLAGIVMPLIAHKQQLRGLKLKRQRGQQ
jgi:heme exporter protein D